MVGKTNHEVVVARVDIGRYLNVVTGIIRPLTGRDGIVLTEYPGLHRVFLCIHRTFHRRSAMGVVVEVVVYLDVIGSQFRIVRKQIVKRYIKYQRKRRNFW